MHEGDAGRGRSEELPAALVPSPKQRVLFSQSQRKVQQVSRIILTNATGSCWVMHVKNTNRWCGMRRGETVCRGDGKRGRRDCLSKRLQTHKRNKNANTNARNGGCKPLGAGARHETFDAFFLCSNHGFLAAAAATAGDGVKKKGLIFREHGVLQWPKLYY
jgi:hypothetical protein